MEFVTLFFKRPFLSLIILISIILIFIFFASSAHKTEYYNAMKNPNKTVQCGFYRGNKEKKGKTNLHKSEYFISLTFDGDNFESDIPVSNINLGSNQRKKPKNLLIGDRVCLTISGHLIVEFKIDK